MVEKVGLDQYSNYNTTAIPSVSKGNTQKTQDSNTSFVVSRTIPMTSSQTTSYLVRTELTTKEEKEKYKSISSKLDRNERKKLEALLKNGILLNNNSEDKSSVLDNLYKILTTQRAAGLNNIGLVKDTLSTIYSPYIITQQFGNIPDKYKSKVIDINNEGKTNLIDIQLGKMNVDVEHSGTCVAASTEFKLAKQNPAEFSRFANELSSPKMAVSKTIQLDNLADNTLNAVWLLNAFNMPYEMNDYKEAKLNFAPDKNAIVRAQIQTIDKDPLERSALDVLMQSTFMQIGSQQSYNTITDKRTGKFNQNDKGLIEFEKTFTESVVFDKNILSVTYQTVDENARLVGYETDLDTMKRHLVSALNMGENVMIGYTQTNRNNIIINGHEITIVGYKNNGDGKLTFICNDTDDDIPRQIEYPESYLLPKIHHAALPKEIVEPDLNMTPSWKEGLQMYKNMKKSA